MEKEKTSRWKFPKNTVAICFIILAGGCILFNRDGWGWCLFLALLTHED